MTTRTRDELHAEMRARFGDDVANWSWTCPSCGDVATVRDFADALALHPRTDRDGDAVTAAQVAGQECIGRTLGALTVPDKAWDDARAVGVARGCSWTAYGLFQGPDFVRVDDREIPCFPITEVA